MRADFDYMTNETSRHTCGRHWWCKKVYLYIFLL